MSPPNDATLASVRRQLGRLMDASQQAMYVYIDDKAKVCNRRMAELLGYPSPEAWAGVTTNFPTAFVHADSQETLIGAYQDAMEHATGAAVPVTWKRKDGRAVETDVLLVPIELDGARFALHFIEPVE